MEMAKRTAVAGSETLKGDAKMRKRFLIAGLVLLVGCSTAPAPISAPTGNFSADVTAWIGEVGTDTAYFEQQAANVNGQVVGGLITAGKAACGAGSELDGLFNSPLAQIGGTVVAVALKDPTKVAAVDASEASVFNSVVKPNCAVIAGLDPSNPTAAGIAAANAVIQAVPQIQQTLAQAAPQVADMLETAAAPPATTPAAAPPK